LTVFLINSEAQPVAAQLLVLLTLLTPLPKMESASKCLLTQSLIKPGCDSWYTNFTQIQERDDFRCRESNNP